MDETAIIILNEFVVYRLASCNLHVLKGLMVGYFAEFADKVPATLQESHIHIRRDVWLRKGPGVAMVMHPKCGAGHPTSHPKMQGLIC